MFPKKSNDPSCGVELNGHKNFMNFDILSQNNEQIQTNN